MPVYDLPSPDDWFCADYIFLYYIFLISILIPNALIEFLRSANKKNFHLVWNSTWYCILFDWTRSLSLETYVGYPKNRGFPRKPSRIPMFDDIKTFYWISWNSCLLCRKCRSMTTHFQQILFQFILVGVIFKRKLQRIHPIPITYT